MAQTLASIEKLYVAEKPPEGARQCGVTPQGKIVWEMDIVRGKNEPDIDPETGMQRWELHPTTAKPVYPRRKLRRIDLKKIFTLEQDGQGNLYMVDYSFPTPEEIAAEEHRKKAAAMIPALADALVKGGLTAEEVVARVMEPVAPTAPARGDSALSLLESILRERGVSPEAFVERVLAQQDVLPNKAHAAVEVPTDEPAAPSSEPSFPKPKSPGRWELSNHEIVKGTRIEAQAAENRLHSQGSDLDVVPEM